MTHIDREQQARAWAAAHELVFEKDIVALIELLADTERATLERVASELESANPQWLAGWAQHFRKQAKEIPS